jgi:subtilisin family serine protease
MKNQVVKLPTNIHTSDPRQRVPLSHVNRGSKRSLLTSKNHKITQKVIEQTCRDGDGGDGMSAGYMSWGIDLTDQTSATPDNTFCVDSPDIGTDIHVYVLDTGVNNHSTFQGRLVNDFDYYDQGGVDSESHGTHVAGILASSIYGIAVNATIHNVRVLDDEGSGTFASLAAGLLYVLHNLPSGIINLSLGVLDAFSGTISAIINSLMDDGFVVVVAAGNDGIDACISFPGNIARVVTVGAYDTERVVADFSNIGSCVDIYGPGVDIISAFGSGSGATLKSGTSMASPNVAGLLAILMQRNSTANSSELITRLYANSNKDVITGLSLAPVSGGSATLRANAVPKTVKIPLSDKALSPVFNRQAHYISANDPLPPETPEDSGEGDGDSAGWNLASFLWLNVIITFITVL